MLTRQQCQTEELLKRSGANVLAMGTAADPLLTEETSRHEERLVPVEQ
jgi:hypothetical protein